MKKLNILYLIPDSKDSGYNEIKSILEDNGARCESVSIYDGYNPETTSKFWRYIRIYKYLIFYVKVLRNSFLPYDLVFSIYGTTAPFAIMQPIRPVVLSFRGSDLLEDHYILCKLCDKYSDATIVMNSEMNEKLGGGAIEIPSGVDLNTFQPIPTKEARKSIGWDNSKYHVLFPYHPSRTVKRFDLAQKVVDQTNRNLDKEVKLHAIYNQPYEKMPLYFNASDVLMITSESEGSPRSVKEAMACNLPIVSVDVGDIRKTIEDVQSSTIVNNTSELPEALEKILVDETWCNGRVHIREMSKYKVGRSIIEVLQEVL